VAKVTQDLSGQWECFEKQHRNLRKKIKRIERNFGDGFSFQVFSKPEEMQRCLQRYIETEQKGWKGGLGISEAENQLFYGELIQRLAEKGQVHFGFISDGSRTVTAELTYTYLNTAYFAHGTYCDDYSHLSPGSVSTALSIKHFHHRGLVDGDFLAGFASYINPWSERYYTTKDTVIFKINRAFFIYAFVRIRQKFVGKAKSLAKRLLTPEQVEWLKGLRKN
jgi:CelD/BcsL family acetyltransferase involved in cellulose biosynthesis